MKQLRYLLLLTVALLTCSTLQAQHYLNVFGGTHGSVPMARIDSVKNEGITMQLFTDQGTIEMYRSELDSLTVTEQPDFYLPVSLEQAFVRYTVGGEQQQVVQLTPVWGLPGVFHTLLFVPGYATFEYSCDQQEWAVANDYYGNPVSAQEGWLQLLLDLRTTSYMHTGQPMTRYSERTSRSLRGFVYVTGAVAGHPNAQDPAWKLSMPVNADGWWASPRFVADGEVRAYVYVDQSSAEWWRTEFTGHDGQLYWRDGELPTGWAADMGSDYSLTGKAGQKLYVNFTTGQVLVSTPDETPFPLENPVFRTASTVGTYDDSTLCTLEGLNTIVLHWNPVDGASGYRVKMAQRDKVSAGGAAVWDNADNLLVDQTLDANTTELRFPNLDYETDYRFAIQALSPRGEEYNSAWFGYGGPNRWFYYLDIMTNTRYAVPSVVQVTDVTKTSVRVRLNRSIADYDPYEQEEFREHFHFTDADQTLVRVDYLTVKPGKGNPDAVVPVQYVKYVLTAEDLERGYVDVEGLSENTAYVFQAWDATIEAAVDACYNSVTRTTKGTPGPPILLSHADLMQQAAGLPIDGFSESRTAVFARAADFDAAPISPALSSYMTSTQLAEGQVFYLEGGKTYYLDGNNPVYRGFTLATQPDDAAQGKRARVICGIGKSAYIYSQAANGEQWNGGPFAMFYLSRQPELGEEGNLEMETLAFHDIDFDNPLCYNYGDAQAGRGTASGNYFFNMWSNSMGFTLDSLVFENCTFKRFVRGFIREQGVNSKVWNHVLIKGNQFMDCGYYNQGAGGYAWIAGSGVNEASNLYKDMQVTENTFFDSPFPALFNETTELDWTGGPWNITFSNNTLVNLNTRGDGSIFKMRRLPDGSVFTVENNLIVLCKQEGDQRVLQQYGADVRNTQTLPNGQSGHVTLNFNNNWSTNNDLTNGQIFSGRPWSSTSSTSRSFGWLVKDGTATLNGSLEVSAASISATDLMEQPCPPHVAQTAADPDMHRADALDGTATTEYNVNLFIKNTDNEIVKNQVGASRWRP